MDKNINPIKIGDLVMWTNTESSGLIGLVFAVFEENDTVEVLWLSTRSGRLFVDYEMSSYLKVIGSKNEAF